jgi:hypothetical protein
MSSQKFAGFCPRSTEKLTSEATISFAVTAQGSRCDLAFAMHRYGLIELSDE